MDADEIREIREIEAKVAEHVMGWTNLASPPPKQPSLSWRGKPPDGTSTDYYVPEYARLIEKAWRVVEHLRLQGLKLTIEDERPWLVRFLIPHEVVYLGRGETVPEAVCAAALDWAERRKQENT